MVSFYRVEHLRVGSRAGEPFPCDAGPMDTGSSHQGWVPSRVRCDDLVTRVGHEFVGPLTTGIAARPEDVRGLLASAQREAEQGRWVVCFVGYEAASAFEPAVAARAFHRLLPLAWFTSFERRTRVPVVEAPARDSFTVGARRVHGSGWYRDGVERIRTAIEAGDVYQVNLTDRVLCSLKGEVGDLYRAMATTQGGRYNAFIEFDHAAIVSASPELFLRIEDGTVSTRPMKGTRRRHGRPDEDAHRARELAASEKDLAENLMIVDLLRNDLSRVAEIGGVCVPELFCIERYETVWQLTSTVEARLRREVDLVDVFAAAFPCGSVTGAPKIAAMNMIRELESTPRGLYCGSIGVIEPTSAGMLGGSTWSVAIRTAVVDTVEGVVEFGAGGGITYDSEPAAEDDELESKTVVLGGARSDFALFETIRLDAAGAHHLDRHLRRLAASAAYFGFECDMPTIGRKVAALAAVDTLHRLRVTLARDGGVTVEVLPVTDGPVSVRLAIAAQRVRSDDPFCCHKTTNRGVYEAARAAHPEADDVVLVNERGEVVETTIANLLYCIDGRWYTPPLAAGGLPGIGREVLVEAGEVAERALPLERLGECGGFEVVSALRGRRRAEILAR